MSSKCSNFLESLHQHYTLCVAENSDYSEFVGAGRHAILVKKALTFSIKYIYNQEECNRVSGIQIHVGGDSPLFVFGTYLPSDNNIQEYRDCVQYLDDIYKYYSQLGTVIYAGDCNAQFDTTPLSATAIRKSELFKDFLTRNSLVAVNKTDTCSGYSYTFVPLRTTIDYVLIPDSFQDCVLSCKVFSNEYTDVASDHLPIYCKLCVPTTTNFYVYSDCSPILAWDKASTENLVRYQLMVSEGSSELLSNFLSLNVNSNNIEKINLDITNLLLDASYNTIPITTFKSNRKPYWTKEVRDAHRIARKERNTWIADCRPRGNIYESYRNYKAAKRSFINIQNDAYQKYEDDQLRQIDNAAECDVKYFWKLWKKRNNRARVTCREIRTDENTVRVPTSIAEAFAKYYSGISDSKENRFAESYGDVPDEIQNQLLNSEFTFDEIDSAVRSLKFHKSPGVDRIQNEHLRYAGRNFLLLIVRVFNAIAQHGYVPDVWKKGLIVPVHKGGQKPLHKCESYRPIALLCGFYKLFEKVILNRIHKWIDICSIPFPHRQQQGFTKSLNCITTSFALSESVWSVIEEHSMVYCAFLDIMRAFDTVWHSGLMHKLMNLGIKGQLLRIIDCCYSGVQSAVLINGSMSSWFPVRCGVRQGGVLSTFLYKLFIDNLLHELEHSNFGIRVSDINCGNPAFADDLALMATSPLYLQNLLNICFRYSEDWKFQFSGAKTDIVLFKKGRPMTEHPFIWKLGSDVIRITKAKTHLGIVLNSNLTNGDAVSNACDKGRKSFYGLFGINSYAIDMNPLTYVNLYRKIVIPSALYGCELWNALTQKRPT